jgi:hypothetical protein
VLGDLRAEVLHVAVAFSEDFEGESLHGGSSSVTHALRSDAA